MNPRFSRFDSDFGTRFTLEVPTEFWITERWPRLRLVWWLLRLVWL